MGFLGLFPEDTQEDSNNFSLINTMLTAINQALNELQQSQTVASGIVSPEQITAPIKQTILTAQQNTIGQLSQKIFTGTKEVTNAISASENRIVGKIAAINGNISAELDETLNKLAAQIYFSQNTILNKVNQGFIGVSKDISFQTEKLGNALTLIEGRISNRIGNLSNDIIEASRLEINADIKIANEQNRIIREIFGNIAKQIADELGKEFKRNDINREKQIIDYALEDAETMLRDAMIDAFRSNAFKDAIHPPTNKFLDFINSIFNGVNAVSNVLTDLVSIGGETGNLLSKVLDGFGADTVLNMFIQFSIEPYMRHFYNQASRGARSDLLTVEQALSLYLYDPANKPKAKAILEWNGLTDEDIEYLFKMTERPLSEEDLQTLYYRGEIEKGDLIRRLWKIGITEDTIDQRFELWKIIPPIQDIIRMAVRDVFTPSAITEFGLEEDLPPDYVEWATKAGLSEYWSKKYWASHWTLPSSNQGFEMFQRGIINQNQLETLLKALDIIPAWREKLIQLNYATITRVDVRRMHDMGFLTDEQVTRRYQDIGYSPQDALLMTEWTKAYNDKGGEDETERTRQLTISMITRGYKAGLLTETEAIFRLGELGYNEQNAQYILQLEILGSNLDAIPDKLKDNIRRLENVISKGYVNGLLSSNEAIEQYKSIGFSDNEAIAEISYLDLEVQITADETVISLIKTRFVQYQLTEDKARELLRVHGFPDNEINRQISLWNLERLYRNKLPSKAEIKSFLLKGIIEVEQARQYLRGLGYPDETCNMYIIDWSS